MVHRYDTYKDSGVQWLGEIPSHWECVRLKNLGTCQNGVSKGGDYFGEGFPFVSYSDAYKNIVLPTTVQGLARSTVDDRFAYSVEKGDVLFTRTSETIDEIGFASTCLETIKDSVFAGFLIRFRPNTCSIIPEYYKYYFRSMHLRKFFTKEMNIVTRASLSQQLLGQLKVLIPSINEQKSISSYLDRKCNYLDEWLSKKQKEVEHLQELKQCIIADAVTRGLNPNVTMKQTNIPWLSEIPVHWDILRLKSLFNQRSESYNPDETLQVLSLLKDVGVIPYNEKGSIGNKSKEDYSQYKVTRKGDIVMNSMNVIIGSVDITAYDGYISPAYYALYAKDGVCTEYYNYIFHLKAVQKAMRSLANGILEIRLRISTTNLFGMYYPVPPLSEQKQIVAHIADKTSKIDKLIANINKEIESIKEYKQRLISDVVTGQIKVC